MSTKEKQKRGSGAAAVVIILCAAALAALAWVVYRQLCPTVLETVEMYAASETADAPSYEDAERTPLGSILRGAAVQCVKEDVDSGAELVRVENGLLDGKVSYLYMERANLAATQEDSVLTETVYALRGMSLTDETGTVPGCAVEKGMALTVIGFDGISSGEVLRWQVSCERGEGFIDGENVRMTEEEALAQYDEALYQLHAARGDAWGGGDAAGLDYYPTEKPTFTDNVMPDEVRALYLNGSAIQYADSYIRLAQGTGINAFVVDIVDGTAVSYASPVMQQYSPSAYAAAQDTMENFRANVQKLRDAGFYTIGRITVFNDAHLAADHPEYVISDLSGTPLKISSMYWPSAYNRTVWQYKTELALEAAAGYYVSGDVFGECANAYVTACGQYWPAISAVVDAISGMPYPDHYSARGDYKPWEHPYDTVHMFGESAAARQSETSSPAAVRTWIQCYNAIREPYNHYGAAELADEVRALRDTGNTGGFMTWNGTSDIGKYAEVIGALN